MTAPASQLRDGSPNLSCYRPGELQRIVASLLAGSGVVVISEQGYGKTELARFVQAELKSLQFTTVFLNPGTQTDLLHSVAEQLGIPITNVEGKKLLLSQLKEKLLHRFTQPPVVLVIGDDAQEYPKDFRRWLRLLWTYQVPMVLFATNPLKKCIFSKLVPLFLEPLPDDQIAAIIHTRAQAQGILLPPDLLNNLVSQSGGNPHLAFQHLEARRIGIPLSNPDHSELIDATPCVIAIVSFLAVVRFLGLAFNNPLLYVFGGILGLISALMQSTLSRLMQRPTKRLKR